MAEEVYGSKAVNCCKLWFHCNQALQSLLETVHLYCLSTRQSEDSSSSSSRLLLQAGEELVKSGLLQQLPRFLWQSVQLIAAAGQPLPGTSVVTSLTAELLLQAALEWERQYLLLPDAQQQLVLTWGDEYEYDDAPEAVYEVEDLMRPAHRLLKGCCQLLVQQSGQLWANGQWQTLSQLLQQGGGQVLLLGMTLAVRCGSLGCSLGMEDMPLLLVLKPIVVSGDPVLSVRGQMFASQLARKHLVPFCQFLDICASSSSSCGGGGGNSSSSSSSSTSRSTRHVEYTVDDRADGGVASKVLENFSQA
ncbi:hypothetical protein OEZ86_003330 [Tetradesmus obliquus]|nr:hypothetical protein OEZ86_003330 [Tetradesmus obliquus]